MCQKRNQPIIGYIFLGITCLSIMTVMVACIEIEENPISPQVVQCREREPVPQVLQAPRIRYVGDIFRDCPNCPEMVVLPGGFFLMGAPPDAFAGREERPYHPVTIAEPFAVGRYEVTFDEWDACVAEGGCDCYEPEDEDWGRGRRPVINVSWEEAQDYLYWLGRKTGKPYRLLSEAEWEYAVRAGTNTDVLLGGLRQCHLRLCERGRECLRLWWQRDEHCPWGRFVPNPFGLFDMIGNVQEWTADCWNDTYEGAPADGRAWQQGDCYLRVTRGRSFYWKDRYSDDFRSFVRHTARSGWGKPYIGFRVAREMTVAQIPVPLD